MSTEYIERGALIGAIEATEFLTMQDAATTLQLVTEAPAADVEPVVRGEWIEHYDECECPVCGETWNYCDNDTERFDCCPKCGAHMVVPKADVYGCAENGALLTNVHIGLKTEYETPHECGYCGEHVAKDWSFCPECGRKLHMDERSDEK